MERSELTYLCWMKLFSPCTHLKELVSTAAKCGKSLFCNLAKQLFGVHLGIGRRVFQNAKSQNFKVAVSQNWLLYQTKSLQKELGFFLQNCGSAQFLKFWVYHNGKRAPGGAKICNFQKLA